jgi:hypothetical protein
MLLGQSAEIICAENWNILYKSDTVQGWRYYMTINVII